MEASAPTEGQLAPPPPPYEMILDLKRREVQLDLEIAEEERAERASSTRGRIRNLLGRVRPKKTSPEAPPPPLEAYVASSSSQAAMAPPGLFTISREGLPPPQDYHTATPPPYHRHASSPSDTSSHSDYSSSFISSPSSSSNSLSTSSSQDPPEYLPPAPLEVAAGTPEPQEDNPSEEQEAVLEHAGSSRPCTGRSFLSRPTTSISTRTLPPPPQLARKTSLPGAVLEHDEADK